MFLTGLIVLLISVALALFVYSLTADASQSLVSIIGIARNAVYFFAGGLMALYGGAAGIVGGAFVAALGFYSALSHYGNLQDGKDTNLRRRLS